MIFSDTAYDGELPGNVKIINISLRDVSDLAGYKMGYSIDIGYAYKLCDFKPAYGFIFSEYIKDYDFWGQSDIDVIYGDIQGFITDEVLTEFDFISVRHDYTTGCFALYRNNALMNNIFRRSKDCRKVLTDSRYWGFDEFNFLHPLLSDGSSIFNFKTEIETFTHIIKKADMQKEIKAYFDFILLEGVPGRIKFNKGRIIYDNKVEAVLYHLFWLKKVYKPGLMERKIPDQYYISPKRIYFKTFQ